jgi:membrane protease YdiL (CAAX protease family)
MRDKKLLPYLLWSFALAWPIQALASWQALQGNTGAFQLIMVFCMFMPLLAAVLARVPLGDLGWRPGLRQNWRWLLAAWLAPVLLMVLGAALYYLVFPSRFDLSGKTFLAQLEAAGPEALAQYQAQALPVSFFLLIQTAAALTYAPFINIFPSLGEGIGWRGVMLPRLKERFGRRRGLLLGGLIWGAWHWPVMLLAGYEYGLSYWGFPVLGMLVFCLFTTALGIFLDLLYEKTGSIWYPALGHGAVNAVAGVPLLLQDPAYTNEIILGPSIHGLIAGIPLLLFGVLLLLRPGKKGEV